MFTSSIKREAFSRRSCAKTGKEMYVQSCCFAYKQEFDAKGESTLTTRLQDTLSVP